VFLRIYIYIYMPTLVHSLHLFCPLLSTHLLPQISLPATQSISAIVQASSWYIYCCKMVSVCLSIMASLTMPVRVNHLGEVCSWPPYKNKVIKEFACVLITYWKLEAEEVHCVADSGLCQMYIYSLYVCMCARVCVCVLLVQFGAFDAQVGLWEIQDHCARYGGVEGAILLRNWISVRNLLCCSFSGSQHSVWSSPQWVPTKRMTETVSVDLVNCVLCVVL
jgi:hypothetical protein